MFPLLFFIPVFVTLFLGVAFLFLGSASPGFKLAGVVVFAVAVYLQFFSRFDLAGLLIQVALALSLVLWRRMDAGSP
jgi:hypothetical protein